MNALELKSFQFAHKELKDSLHDWMLLKRQAQGEIDESSVGISRRIDQASDRIQKSVREISSMPELDADEDLVFLSVESIHFASTAMAEAVDEGTDAMIDHCKDFKVFDSWDEVCGAVESFAKSAAKELNDLRLKHRDKGVPYRSLFLAATRTMDVTAILAFRCRKRGIKRISNLLGLED